MKTIAIFSLALAGLASYLGSWISKEDPGMRTYIRPIQALSASIAPSEEKPAPIPEASSFPRGHTSKENIPWQKMPCRNNASGEAYASDILSKEEIIHHLLKAGFAPEQANIMQAIAKAESGHQLDCIGDEALANSKWDNSFGIFQIRGLKAHGGGCRDISQFKGNIERQAQCAFEISNGGKNFRPWTMYLNGRFKEYL